MSHLGSLLRRGLRELQQHRPERGAASVRGVVRRSRERERGVARRQQRLGEGWAYGWVPREGAMRRVGERRRAVSVAPGVGPRGSGEVWWGAEGRRGPNTHPPPPCAVWQAREWQVHDSVTLTTGSSATRPCPRHTLAIPSPHPRHTLPCPAPRLQTCTVWLRAGGNLPRRARAAMARCSRDRKALEIVGLYSLVV